MICKGLSQTHLRFIFLLKGDSVGRYKRYPLIDYDVRSSSTALMSAALVTPLASNTPSAPS